MSKNTLRLLAGVLIALVALPAAGQDTAKDTIAKDTVKAQRAEKDAAQRDAYLRNVPPGLSDHIFESDVIKMHSTREWSLLTYPTGVMPSMPWNRAKSHVEANVPDAAPWPGEGVPLKNRFSWQKAMVAPNTNTWTAVGPSPLDSTGTTNNAYQYGIVGGRVAAGGLAVDPTNTDVAYAGFVAGGLWKTTNLSAAMPTWTPLWDDLDIVTQSVGAITIDPNDSNTIWVGTGDWAGADQFGAGIMKSTDAGATWTQLAADVFTPHSTTVPAGGNRWGNQNIKALAVDPNQPSTLLVGTRYDLYISHDAGSSWEICTFGANPTDPTTGSTINAINRISGIYLDSRAATTTAYVAVGYYTSGYNGNNGVYRFTVPTSGCPAWPGDFETLFNGFPANTGNGVNGGSVTARIELAGAVGPDSGLTLYAQVEDGNTYGKDGTYVLRPDGGSTTWTKLSESIASECNQAGFGQDWYDLFIGVDPADDKSLYVGHIDVYKATVNASYTSITFDNLTDVYGYQGCPNYGKVHPDQHTVAWIGNTGQVLVGNDGGVYKNVDGTSNGWSHLNDDFNVHQFYAGQIGADFAGNGQGGAQWLFGGLQDNGNASWDSSQSNDTWTGRSVGGDGFYVSFDPINGTETSGLWMTEYTYGSMYSSTSGADGPFSSGCNPQYFGSADWSTPFMLDTLHCTDTGCDNYLVGEDYAWVASSIRRGCPVWKKVSGSLVKTGDGSIITVGMAPSEPKAAAVGTSDGKVWWTETAFSGTSCTQAAANTASFTCAANTGAAWVDADAANAVLPNRAVMQVTFDPNDHNVFYAAVGGFNPNTPTEPGHVFQMTQSGGSISVADKTGNLPDVPAASIAVNPHNRKQVFVGTYFGFYYTDDVDAGTPVWVRYDAGLPTTVIKHLTIDRGPASNPLLGTTLAAFTYGRGVYVLKLPTTGGGNNAPAASFTTNCTALDCDFTDTSTDSDGTVVSWDWDFGDTGTSTAQNPSHSYGADNTYTVTLTVTDDQGAQDSTSQPVTVTSGGGGGIVLSAVGYKVQGTQHADLTWSGAVSANVDVYRDNVVVIGATPNDGFETENIGAKGGGTYVYKVCEEGTSTCSNEVTVVF